MAFKPFRTLKIAAEETVTPKVINDIQLYISQCIGQLTGKDTLDQRLLTSVALATGLNQVSHKLGRDLQGWTIVRTHVPSGTKINVIDQQDTNKAPHLLLYLNSDQSITVDILVF